MEKKALNISHVNHDVRINGEVYIPKPTTPPRQRLLTDDEINDAQKRILDQNSHKPGINASREYFEKLYKRDKLGGKAYWKDFNGTNPADRLASSTTWYGMLKRVAVITETREAGTPLNYDWKKRGACRTRNFDKMYHSFEWTEKGKAFFEELIRLENKPS